jgi:hypothetical protein
MSEYGIERDLEGSNCDPICDTIPEYAWWHREKSQSVRISSLKAGI